MKRPRDQHRRHAQTGSNRRRIERRTHRTTGLLSLEPRVLLTAVPIAEISSASTQALLGETLNLSVRFDNTDLTDTGYAPYIDLVMPAAGVDGNDGISYAPGSASYLGLTLAESLSTFPASGQLAHPWARDSKGAPLIVTGRPGDQLVSLELPFGSFTPDQPAANVGFRATTSRLADLGSPLPVQVRSGFRLGSTPLEDWATDPSILGQSSSISLTPSLLRVSTTIDAPEAETATGPNFARSATVRIDVAEGATLSNLTVDTRLASNLVYGGVESGSGWVVAKEPPRGIASNAPTSTLVLKIGTVTGTASSADLSYRVLLSTPALDASSRPVVDPATGRAAESTIDVTVTGDGKSEDPRDPAVVATTLFDATGPEARLANKALAAQLRSSIVVDTGAAGLTAGDLVSLTTDFQVSDYFGFSDLAASVRLSDGLRVDSSFVPVLVLSENGVTSTINFDAANWQSVVAPDGSVLVSFAIANQLASLGRSSLTLGGHVLDGDSIADPATTGSITFRARVQDTFTVNYPSGDPSLNEGDRLTATSQVAGVLLDVSGPTPVANPSGIVTVTDTSSASLSIARGRPELAVHAVNGIAGAPAVVRPGDEVTYRITYNLTQGDYEALSLTAYLPMPLFRASDPDANGANLAWSIVPTSSTLPRPGQLMAVEDPQVRTPGAPSPTITASKVSNSISLSFGTIADVANRPARLSYLLTVRATNDPIGDRLYLTTLLREQDRNTSLELSAKDAVIQVLTSAPDVKVTKGVIGTTNPTGVLTLPSAGPVVFSPPGTTSSPWTGVINSQNLETTPINADVRDVDAGDLVRFAIVLENRGSSSRGAFDLRLKDALPSGFAVPTGGLKLTVTDGASNPLSYIDLGGGLLGNGIELIDSASRGALAGHDPLNGQNILVVTYDLVATSTVEPGVTSSSIASLLRFAGTEAGPDYTTIDRTDAATLTTKALAFAHILRDTDRDFTTDTRVVVGEIATYQLVVTIPEGRLRTATLTQTLDAGLAFVSIDSIEASPGLNFGAGTLAQILASARIESVDATADGQARRLFAALGDVDNRDRDDTVPETLTVTFRAIALNSSQFKIAQQRGGTARLAYGTRSTSASGGRLTLVEPRLRVDMRSSVSTADAGDIVTFTATVSTTSGDPPAFDLRLESLLPAGLDYVPASLRFVGTGVAPSSLDASTLNARWTRLDAGQSSVIEFKARANQAILAGQLLPVSARIDWSSLPGTPGALASTSPLAYERTGNPTDPGGSANTYVATRSITPSVVRPTLATSVVATSLPATTAAQYRVSAQDLAIGEDATFRTTVTLPESTTPLTVSLALGSSPARLVPITSRVVSIGSSLSGSVLLPGDAGRLVDTDGDGSPDRVDFDFGLITNAWNNLVNDQDRIVLELVARAADIAANQAGAAPSQVARLNDAAGLISSQATVDLVAPVLSTPLTASRSFADAGDSVEFTLVVGHASTSTQDAFDLRVATPIARPGLILVPGSVTSTLGQILSGNGNDEGSVEIVIPTLPLGQTATIRYRATVTSTSDPGEVIRETAQSQWDSWPAAGGRAAALDSSTTITVNATTIAGRVFDDLDGDGRSTSPDSGISAVSVQLTGVDHLGNTVDRVLETTPDGRYAFDRLRPGLYTLIELSQPTGYLDGPERSGSLGGLVGQDQISEIRVPAGSRLVSDGYTFAEYAPARLHAILFNDTNNDALIGQNELGVGGVSVALTGVDVLGNSVTRTLVSESNGCVEFESLLPGTYSLTTGLPDGLLTGRVQAGTAGGTVAPLNIAGVRLSSGTNGLGYTFAYLMPSSLRGFVYGDHDRDRIRDQGELGISAVPVTLTGTDDLGRAVLVTILTDDQGLYSFSGLRPGRYSLLETQPSGWIDGLESLGSFEGQPSPIARNGTARADRFDAIQLRPGEAGYNYNFGEWADDDEPVNGNGYDQVITLPGTGGDDQFSFRRSISGSFVWSLNGVDFTYEAGDGITFVLPDQSGSDWLAIEGVDSPEILILRAGSGSYWAPGVQIRFSGIERVEARGGTDDRAYFYDTDGDDRFDASPTSASMTSGAFFNSVSGYDRVYAYATVGQDVANLIGSASADTLKATSTGSRLYGDRYWISVQGFDAQNAEAGLGGLDRAYLYGSPGDDRLESTPRSTRLQAGKSVITAAQFGEVYASDDQGGLDTAILAGSTGDDLFDAGPTEARLSGAGYLVSAAGFDMVEASGSGGADRANLRDSRGNDTFEASPTRARLWGLGFDNRALDFTRVYAYAEASCDDNDTAWLTDSAGNDTFRADPGLARLYSDRYYNSAIGFQTVHAKATLGVDLVQMWDSAGDDRFESGPSFAEMVGPGFQHTAVGFDRSEAYSIRGGRDVAIVRDSSGDDLLRAWDDVLSLVGEAMNTRVQGFAEVRAIATTGRNTKRLSTLRFSLLEEGPWTS